MPRPYTHSNKPYRQIGQLKMPKSKTIQVAGESTDSKLKLNSSIRKYASETFDLNKSKLESKGYTKETFVKQFTAIASQNAKTTERKKYNGNGDETISITSISISGTSKKLQHSDIYIFENPSNYNANSPEFLNKRFAKNISKGTKFMDNNNLISLESIAKKELYGKNYHFKTIDYNKTKYGGRGEIDGQDFQLIEYHQNGKDLYTVIWFTGKYNNETSYQFVSEEYYNELKRNVAYHEPGKPGRPSNN